MAIKFVTAVFLGLFGFLPQNTADVRYGSWSKIAINNSLVRSPSFNATILTVARCAAECLDAQVCLTFAFHKDQKLCLLYDFRIYTSALTEIYAGLKYYWIHSDCDYGFEYYPAVHICVRIFVRTFAVHNHDEAQSRCHSFGSHLVFMDTAEKGKFLVHYVQSKGKSNYQFYIGGDDIYSTGTYTWLDGKVVDRNLWLPNQPDKTKKCMTMFQSATSFMLKTVSCTQSWHYICEIPVA